VALAHNLPNSSLRFESVCDSRRSRQNKKALTASSHSTQHRSSKNISLHIAAGSSEFSRRGPLHPTPQTPHPKPHTPNPIPYTLHPTPQHPTLYTLQPETIPGRTVQRKFPSASSRTRQDYSADQSFLSWRVIRIRSLLPCLSCPVPNRAA